MNRSLVAATALRVPLAGPACPECRGGGEINGLTCRACGGEKRVRARGRRDWRALRGRVLLAAAGPVGTVLGWYRSVPGVGGAAAVSAGLGGVAGHVFGHGLSPWVAATVAGCFGLMMDRRL